MVTWWSRIVNRRDKGILVDKGRKQRRNKDILKRSLVTNRSFESNRWWGRILRSQ